MYEVSNVIPPWSRCLRTAEAREPASDLLDLTELALERTASLLMAYQYGVMTIQV